MWLTLKFLYFRLDIAHQITADVGRRVALFSFSISKWTLYCTKENLKYSVTGENVEA